MCGQPWTPTSWMDMTLKILFLRINGRQILASYPFLLNLTPIYSGIRSVHFRFTYSLLFHRLLLALLISPWISTVWRAVARQTSVVPIYTNATKTVSMSHLIMASTFRKILCLKGLFERHCWRLALTTSLRKARLHLQN